MANQSIVEAGKNTRFKAGNKFGKGRPPKLFGGIIADLKKEGYEPISFSQLKEAYELFLGLDESKIKELVADTTAPMPLRIIGKTLLSKDGMKTLNGLMDRVFGKSLASVAVTNSDKYYNSYSDLTTEELRKLIENI